MFAVRKLIFVVAVLNHSTGNGFNLTITHRGKQFVNIHLDSDLVQTPCSLDNICIPITFSLVYCSVLNEADRDIEVGVSSFILVEAGFLF